TRVSTSPLWVNMCAPEGYFGLLSVIMPQKRLFLLDPGSFCQFFPEKHLGIKQAWPESMT
ncbi:MAG: hypothetical protein KAY91_01375, partial [Rhodocyclaceae bacterium]|nr:hypothetical protein [Rhodocyclaceae bacterium]